MIEAPKEIWLQYYDDEAPYPDAPFVAKEDRGDMTWAAEAVNPYDIKYVRADVMESALAEKTTELADLQKSSEATDELLCREAERRQSAEDALRNWTYFAARHHFIRYEKGCGSEHRG